MRQRRAILFFVLVVPAVLCTCARVRFPVEETKIIMDTLVRVSVYRAPGNRASVRNTIDRTFEMMKGLEQSLSAHISGSDISRINEEAGIKQVAVNAPAIKVLSESIVLSQMTDGFFDVTVGSVKNLWHFDDPEPAVPSIEEVMEMLGRVDYTNIKVEDSTAALTEKGMYIDLGGVAKGYIIDSAVDFLKQQGVSAGIVDAGGDLRIFGTNPRAEFWKIGLLHPRNKQGIAGVILTKEAAIATSGDYQRFFFADSVRYHHILDPRTGFPARGCISVTIQTDSGLYADALATAVFVMGPVKGFDFIQSRKNVEGIIMYEEHGAVKTLVSDGLTNNYHGIETGRK